MSQADKATAAELLRAAEHMRQRGEALSLTGNRLKTVHGQANVQAAEALEREAKRLQAIEAQQSKRSWPEGWPPFAVLRRAYAQMDKSPSPSVKSLDVRGQRCRAIALRMAWREVLAEVTR